jgi:uncharacterized protein YmfQ (DUF2313 family)
MDAEGYVSLFKALLPEGPAWPTSEQTDGTTGFDVLLSALAQEPARIDAAALLLLEMIIPDNSDTDLDAWEEVLGAPDTDLSDAARLTRIRGILRSRGEVDLASLQAVAQRAAGDDPGVLLTNRAVALSEANIMAAGDAVHDHRWGFVYAVRYMESVLNAQPNAFQQWDDTAAVSTNVARSPSKETLVADRVTGTLSFGLYDIGTAISNTVDNDEVRLSVWARAQSVDCSMYIACTQRDVATVILGGPYPIKTDLWQKITLNANVGVGASDPRFGLAWSPSTDLYLADAYAGIRDLQLEQIVTASAPIHTAAQFMIQGEDE